MAKWQNHCKITFPPGPMPGEITRKVETSPTPCLCPWTHRTRVHGRLHKTPNCHILISDGSQWGQMAMPPPHPFEWRLSANVAEPEEGKRLATRLAATVGSLMSPLRLWRVAGFAACWAPQVLLVWETYKNIKNPWGAEGVDQATSWNTNGFEMDAGMDTSSWYFS